MGQRAVPALGPPTTCAWQPLRTPRRPGSLSSAGSRENLSLFGAGGGGAARRTQGCGHRVGGGGREPSPVQAAAPGSGARPHGADLPLGKTLSAHPLGRGPARLRKLRPALPGPRPPPLTSPPAPCWIFCCSWATRRRAPSICSSRWLPGFWLCASQMRWGQAGVRQVTPQPWGEMGSPPPRRSTSFHPHLGAKQGGNGEKRMREAIEKGRGHEPPAPGLP